MELETALDVALKRYESGFRDMEVKKHELVDLSQQHRFRPSDEFTSFKIIKSLREDVAVTRSLLNSTEREVLFVVPEITFAIGSLYRNKDAKKLVERGGELKAITDFSYKYIDGVQEDLDIGIDVRQLTGYQGVLFGVFDRKTAISAINADLKRISLDEPLSLLWTDDPTYANYLVSTFELLWKQAVPAAQRIEELLQEGPP